MSIAHHTYKTFECEHLVTTSGDLYDRRRWLRPGITVSELLQELASDVAHELVCGVPYAALPIATVMSSKTLTPMLVRRKEAKVYGTKKILEGVYRENQKCLIVEDVVTSGGSLLETADTLRGHGLVVADAVVVLDREQGGAGVLRKNGIKMKSLFTLGELVKILHKANKIDQRTVEIVLDHINECRFDSNADKDNFD
ncbi:Uridine 5'-monophosphate synthase [Eumeta japonica]|uniref:Uridine 5'-monophosphate synthase n=1 Tax=Eumeta variegata TaxID=151549 RepID=A0A4C1Y6W4_EUMVA|nr:Uridine 5'-monophosphate synthase [Eumeta japonica]